MVTETWQSMEAWETPAPSCAHPWACSWGPGWQHTPGCARWHCHTGSAAHPQPAPAALCPASHMHLPAPAAGIHNTCSECLPLDSGTQRLLMTACMMQTSCASSESKWHKQAYPGKHHFGSTHELDTLDSVLPSAGLRCGRYSGVLNACIFQDAGKGQLHAQCRILIRIRFRCMLRSSPAGR